MLSSQQENNRCISRISTAFRGEIGTYIISISESRASPSEIGIAALNMETFEVVLTQVIIINSRRLI